MAKEDVAPLSGKLTLVYAGISDKERQVREDAFKPRPTRKDPTHDGFEYPRTPKLDFHVRKNDKEIDIMHKEKRREKFRKERLAEMQEEIETIDAARQIAGIAFAKDKPKTVDCDRLEVEEARKLAVAVKMGILRLGKAGEQPAPQQGSGGAGGSQGGGQQKK